MMMSIPDVSHPYYRGTQSSFPQIGILRSDPSSITNHHHDFSILLSTSHPLRIQFTSNHNNSNSPHQEYQHHSIKSIQHLLKQNVYQPKIGRGSGHLRSLEADRRNLQRYHSHHHPLHQNTVSLTSTRVCRCSNAIPVDQATQS